jgi:TRAP-type C4-dicarboxylate transport system substrate-binding protein
MGGGDGSRKERGAKMLKKLLLAGLGLSVLSLSSAQAGEALHLSVTSGLPANHVALKIFRSRFQDEITRRLEAENAGSVVWDETHAGTLSHFGGSLEAVEDDLSTFAIISVSHETKRLPLQDMTFHAPFTTENCALMGEAYHAIHRNLRGMTGQITAAHQTYLSAMASDDYNFIATQKIRNAADIRGMAIGVVDPVSSWVTGAEGLPVRLQADLLGARLEAGTLIGALLPNTEMRRLGLKKFADHYTRAKFGAQVPFIITVNTRALKVLPDALRSVVLETASGFASTSAQDYCAAGVEAVDILKSQGVLTAKLLKSRRFQWADALGPVAQKWAARNDKARRPGSKAMASFMSHLSAAGVTLTRDWSAPAPLDAVPKMTPPG